MRQYCYRDLTYDTNLQFAIRPKKHQISTSVTSKSPKGHKWKATVTTHVTPTTGCEQQRQSQATYNFNHDETNNRLPMAVWKQGLRWRKGASGGAKRSGTSLKKKQTDQ